MAIVKGAGLVMKAIIEEGDAEIAAKMQDLALAEGALPRHLHTAMFTQSIDSRMLTVRSVCLSLCLSVCLSICLYVRPSVCPSVYLSVCLPRHPRMAMLTHAYCRLIIIATVICTKVIWKNVQSLFSFLFTRWQHSTDSLTAICNVCFGWGVQPPNLSFPCGARDAI